MGNPMRNVAFCFCLLAITSCSGSALSGVASLGDAIAACSRGAHFQEVSATGTVVRVLGTRQSSSGEHEGFIAALFLVAPNSPDLQSTKTLDFRSVSVEDNTGITGPIPLHRGDAVTLQGQYECDDGVIHWTHHDPRGRHAAGYVEVNGWRYQ